MKDAKAVFIDTNILLRANVEEAPSHHECLAAITNLSAKGTKLWISRQILREYLSVLTRPQDFMNPRPISTVVSVSVISNRTFTLQTKRSRSHATFYR